MAAHTASCQRCGALIPVTELTAWIRCGHCHHQQPLDPQLYASLQQYRHQVAADVRGAAEDRAMAAKLEGREQQVTKGGNVALGVGLMMGLPILTVAVGVVLLQAGVIGNRQMPLVSFAAIGAAMVGVILYLVIYSWGSRRDASSVDVGQVTISCPNCGANHAYRHGQALDRCHFCGAALMPSATVIQAGLSAARAQRRQAEMERWRRERSLVATYQGMSASPGTILLFAFGPLALTTGYAAVVFTYQMLTGEEPFDPMIFAVWAFCALFLFVPMLGIGWMRHRKRRMAQACEALAHQIQGQPIASLEGLVAWLNRFWPAAHDTMKISTAGLYGGVTGMVEGYAVLVDFSASSDKYRSKRLEISVAAYVPGPSDGTPLAQPLPPAAEQQRQWLRQQGFEAEITAAGLRLVASTATVRGLTKNLEQLAQLAPILHHGTLLVRALGGLPVGPVP